MVAQGPSRGVIRRSLDPPGRWGPVIHRGVDSNPQPEEEEEEGDAPGGRSNMALVPYTENALPALAKLHNSTATFHLAGREVLLNQDWRRSGVAAVVWDAAVVLALYLEALAPVELRGRRHRAGRGDGAGGHRGRFCSVGAPHRWSSSLNQHAGARVTITDRAPALELLSANVRANVPADLRPGSAAVSELSWGSGLERYPAGGFDLVLGADIVYLEDTFPALLATLDHLCADATAVLLACKIRYERDARFLALLRARFSVEEVHFDRPRDIHVYRAVRRAPRAEL
ncbi:unnamed protein product [Boreogadus saida]